MVILIIVVFFYDESQSITEIHPADQFWQSVSQSPDITIYKLCFVQDNGGRFDKADDYDQCEDSIHVWEFNPTTRSFYVAFEVPLQSSINYDYSVMETLSEATNPHPNANPVTQLVTTIRC